MPTSIEACEKEISQKVFKMMEDRFEADSAIHTSLSLFEPVGSVSSLGWATYAKLHEAVAVFSQSLIWSWDGGKTNYAGAPEGTHAFIIECLAELQLPGGIEVEAQLKNEFDQTLKRYPDSVEIEVAHRALRLLYWSCYECIALAKRACPMKDLEGRGWIRMGRKDAARALDVSENTLDNWKTSREDALLHVRTGEYLVNPAHIKSRDQTH